MPNIDNPFSGLSPSEISIGMIQLVFVWFGLLLTVFTILAVTRWAYLHIVRLVRERSERSAGTADTDTGTRMTAAQRFMSNRYYD